MGVVEIKGIDANLSAHVLLPFRMALQMDASYTWQHAVDKTEEGSKIYDNQIPYTPEHTGVTSVTLENPWVNVGWMLTAVGDRYSLPQNIETNLIDGYVEQQITVNRSFTLGKCQLRLQAEVVSLGNVTYDVIRYYPMPGRSFRASIKITY